jgi:hypothetical protein
VPAGCPRRESKTNSQSRSPSEGRTSSHICTQTPDPRLSVGLSKLSTNVGAGCSCHPTSADHFRSPRVSFHPVWPTPVARLRGLILSSPGRLLPVCRPFGYWPADLNETPDEREQTTSGLCLTVIYFLCLTVAAACAMLSGPREQALFRTGCWVIPNRP